MLFKYQQSNRSYRVLLSFLLILGLTPCSGAENWNDLSWVEGYEAGLQKARKVNRPAFVYFQARWCSWCHVYERGTLSNQTVLQAIKQHYVPVLVNFDARPDLLRRFGGFGLPYTVIVTPDDKVLAQMPGILSPEDLTDTLNKIARGKTFPKSLIARDMVRVTRLDQGGFNQFRTDYLDYLDMLFESETGTLSGYLETGISLKRPSPRTWLYLMEQGLWKQRSEQAAHVIHQRLFDAVDGGFFYFIDPHRTDQYLETSKLLEANAWLSHWLAVAGKRYGDPRLIKTVHNGIEYMEQTLWDRAKVVFSSSNL